LQHATHRKATFSHETALHHSNSNHLEGPTPMFARTTMQKAAPRLRATLVAAATVGLAFSAQAQEKFTYLTNWYAQAEHGGFYQSVADGTFKKYGLDVTIRMGGPQVNGMQLLAAGQVDCFMGYDAQTMKGWEQGIKAVTVAAAFQKDPQVIIAHPHIKKFEELKDKTILISSAANTTYWMPKRGLTRSTFNPSLPIRISRNRATCPPSRSRLRKKRSSNRPCSCSPISVGRSIRRRLFAWKTQ
jgi:hypothetical protein